MNNILQHSFSMDERSKRIRNKTKRYISTDEEKYQYKKKKKSNINVQETFGFIKKAIAAKYDEENLKSIVNQKQLYILQMKMSREKYLQLKKNNLLCLVKIKVY